MIGEGLKKLGKAASSALKEGGATLAGNTKSGNSDSAGKAGDLVGRIVGKFGRKRKKKANGKNGNGKRGGGYKMF